MDNEPKLDNRPDDELKKFTKDYSSWGRDELTEKIRFYREKGEQLSPEQKKSKIDEERRKFFGEQQELYNEFKSDLENGARSVKGLSEKYHAFFVHAMPVVEHLKANTGMNNNVSPEQMTVEEKIDALINISPTVSASAIKPEEGKIATMYPFGLLIREGVILSAYRNDAGTFAEDVTKRKSKHDPEAQVTSVQRNIERKIDIAIGDANPEHDEYVGFGAKDGINEFVVEQPVFDAFYINLDSAQIGNDEREEVKKIIFEKYPNIPVVLVGGGGKIISFEAEKRNGVFEQHKKNEYELPKKENSMAVDKAVGTSYFLCDLEKIASVFPTIEGILKKRDALSFSFLGKEGFQTIKDGLTNNEAGKHEFIAFIEKYAEDAKGQYKSRRVKTARSDDFATFSILKKDYEEWRNNFKDGIRGLSSAAIEAGDLNFAANLLEVVDEL